MQLSFRKANVILRRQRKAYPVSGDAIPTFNTPWTSSRGRIGPFFLSLSLHVLLAGSVFLENYIRPPLQIQMASVDQLLADERYDVTWPVLPKDLPPVKPAEIPQPKAARAGDGERPRFTLPQEVVANDPNAASSRQMIWDQAPQVELPQDVPAPNFVEPARPEMQRPRFELAEGQILAPPREAIAPEKAPEVSAAPAAPPDLAIAEPKLRYWSPETEQTAPERHALATETAPEVSSGPNQGLNLDQIQPQARLRYWAPEQEAVEPGKKALAPEKAPQITAAQSGGLDVSQFQRLSRLRYQQEEDLAKQVAPQRQALAETAGGTPTVAAGAGDPSAAGDVVALQTLASLGTVGPPPDPGRAVVGVDPAPVSPDDVPRGQRGGNFSAGPDGAANGSPAGGTGAAETAAGDDGALAAVRIPHLSVTPATPNVTPGVSDGRAPEPGPSGRDVDRETLLGQFRNADLSSRPALGVVADNTLPDPDMPFPGRAVYSLAVNMPNISSYSGSWIMEFAEVNRGAILSGELQPPSPRLKVDPVYPPAAIDERIEGDVVLHAMIRSDGLVDHIEILKRLDSRLDDSAKAALSKWRFNPATKNGVPVDIETVVRIPFRLLPRDEKRR